VEFGKNELGGSVDGHEQLLLAFLGPDLRGVDMEVADRIGLEGLPGRLLPGDLRQPAYAVALKAAMQGRTRQTRNGRLERIQAVVQSQQGVLGDIQRLLLGRQNRRGSRSWPIAAIVHECSLVPLGHRLVVQAVLSGQPS
jgi:hypothetical protein